MGAKDFTNETQRGLLEYTYHQFPFISDSMEAAWVDFFDSIRPADFKD
jgi:hypothetical protein